MYSMYDYPSTIRDIDAQTGIARMVDGEETRVGKVFAPDTATNMPHPTEFDEFIRPETAMQAAAISVQAQMGRFEK